MTVPPMTTHGIMTTGADYWIHLFPLDCEVFWYRADDCRRYIEHQKMPLTIGNSKNGTATGAGYLISKTAKFVLSAEIDRAYIDDFEWAKSRATDRQAGLQGQIVVRRLIEDRVVRLPTITTQSLDARADQLASIDFKLRWFPPWCVEVKTERVMVSANLFIQAAERGHNPTLLHDGKNAIERYTAMPGFKE
jgi:hypothetical protein